MPHGRFFNNGTHHLVVSIADANTGERIIDASVIATVTPLGMGPTRKKLEQMRINDIITYGNFFNFPASSAPFRIVLAITRPSMPVHGPVTAEFEYRLSAPPSNEQLSGSHTRPQATSGHTK